MAEDYGEGSQGSIGECVESRIYQREKREGQNTCEDSGFGPGASVEIVMGSDSDWPCVKPAFDILNEFGVQPGVFVVSAHRTPSKMLAYARAAADRGVRVIIAAAGGAAHLPGMIASCTHLPVVGVPVPLAKLEGMDSLLSIVQMPEGVPVATVGIAAAKNAGLLALRILAISDVNIANKLDLYAKDLYNLVEKKDNGLRKQIFPSSSIN